MIRFYIISVFLLVSTFLSAQDEGNIIKRERLERDKNIFIGIGPSFTLGKNIGDYSVGFNFETGYFKRVNRVLSIGPSFSVVSFAYDQEKTGANKYFAKRYPGDDYITALAVDFQGGDLSLYSFSFNLKLNLIPVMDNTKFSVYGFAKPFFSFANRTEVKGDATVFLVDDFNFNGTIDEQDVLFGYNNYSETLPWESASPEWQALGVTISKDLEEDNRITGGIFVGPGIELNPTKKISFYLQAAFGYTFPVSFVGTQKYEGGDLDKIDEKYPIIKEGFPSINIQTGISFNF